MKSLSKNLKTGIALIGIIAVTSLYAEYVISRPMAGYMQILLTVAWLAFIYIAVKVLGQRTDEVIGENIDAYIILDKPLSEVDTDEADVNVPKKESKPKPKRRYKPKAKKTDEVDTKKPNTRATAKKPAEATDKPATKRKPQTPRKPRKPNTEDNN
jgi:hypothetical protein